MDNILRRGQKLITRNIKCKKCGNHGVVEAHDTINHYPPNDIFKNLGKDTDGYMHFLCPKCGADGSYSPYSFFHPLVKFSFYIIIGIIIWCIYKCVG